MLRFPPVRASTCAVVTRSEGVHFQARQKPIHLAVTQARALDARGRADSFNSRDPAQGGEPFRGEGAERAPRPLELVNLPDKPQDFRCDV